MAERKTGPVKPPVIDLTAREATDPPAAGAKETAPPEAKARPARPGKAASGDALPPPPPPPPPPARPAAELAMPWSAISIAAVSGAVLGAALTYGLANWIALPDRGPAIADPAPAIAALAEQTTALSDEAAALGARIAAVEDTARRTQVSLDATLVQLDTTAAELRQSVADLGAAQQPVDLAAIEDELQTLGGRVAAIAAGASSADAAGIADNLVGLEQSIAALDARLAEAETRAGASELSIASLTSEVEAAKAAIAAQNQTLGGAEVGPAVRLPLIVSGLEAAFAGGRPYTAELESLTALLPDLAVPEPVAAAAGTGLIRPDALAAGFQAALPGILAGRAGESTGDWGQDAVEWAKALLALRPAGEIEGDTPEAIVSRLEGAIGRHDFVAAATLLAQLPEPMRRAAGELGAAIAAHAAADRFVAGLRAQALSSAAVSAN